MSEPLYGNCPTCRQARCVCGDIPQPALDSDKLIAVMWRERDEARAENTRLTAALAAAEGELRSCAHLHLERAHERDKVSAERDRLRAFAAAAGPLLRDYRSRWHGPSDNNRINGTDFADMSRALKLLTTEGKGG